MGYILDILAAWLFLGCFFVVRRLLPGLSNKSTLIVSQLGLDGNLGAW